jgi:hypothetical protein
VVCVAQVEYHVGARRSGIGTRKIPRARGSATSAGTRRLETRTGTGASGSASWGPRDRGRM